MHRVNITFTDEDWKRVKRHCKKIRPYQPVGTTLREILLHDVLPCAPVKRAVPTPSPARAPVTYQEREREGESLSTSLETEWTTTEPFCLLADPSRTLRQIKRAFPKIDIQAQTALIAMWWDERPAPRPDKPRRKGERWKHDGISQGIRGWMGRAQDGAPPRSRQRQSTIQQQAPSHQQDFLLGCDNDPRKDEPGRGRP